VLYPGRVDKKCFSRTLRLTFHEHVKPEAHAYLWYGVYTLIGDPINICTHTTAKCRRNGNSSVFVF